MIKHLIVSSVFLTGLFSICAQAEEILHGKPGTVYHEVGDATYGSDGSYSVRIGNVRYSSDGTSSVQIGDTTHNSDGTTAYRVDENTLLHSDGEVVQRLGIIPSVPTAPGVRNTKISNPVIEVHI